MNSLKKTWILTLVLTTALVLASGCVVDVNDSNDDNVNGTSKKAEGTFSYKIAVASQNEIHVEGINGTIEITGVAGLDSIAITGLRRVGSDSEADAIEHLSDLEVSVNAGSEQISVKTNQPRETNGREYTVNYGVRVPVNMRVTASNVNGIITVANIENRVDAANINGNVVLDDVRGDVDVDLVNGNIICDASLPQNGQIDMNTVNGNLILTIPGSTSATLTASVTNGSISTSNLQFSNVTTSARSFNGTLGAGNGSIRLVAVNGTITATGH